MFDILAEKLILYCVVEHLSCTKCSK